MACSVCEGDNYGFDAEQFLSDFRTVQANMARVGASILKIREVNPELWRKYDVVHKEIVRVRKQWNYIERLRGAVT